MPNRKMSKFRIMNEINSNEHYKHVYHNYSKGSSEYMFSFDILPTAENMIE